MTNQATVALWAAKHKHIWGRHAALRYVQRRSVHPSLYRLACQLEVEQTVSVQDALTDSVMYASMLLDSVMFKSQAI